MFKEDIDDKATSKLYKYLIVYEDVVHSHRAGMQPLCFTIQLQLLVNKMDTFLNPHIPVVYDIKSI